MAPCVPVTHPSVARPQRYLLLVQNILVVSSAIYEITYTCLSFKQRAFRQRKKRSGLSLLAAIVASRVYVVINEVHSGVRGWFRY